MPIPSTINGVVTAVNGNLIQLAGGLVTVDASNARFTGEGSTATIADVKQGTFILAILTGDSTTPPRASTIVITRTADVTLTGRIENVDAQARTFTLLGATLHVNNDTSFGNAKSFADLQPGQLAAVQANRSGTQLVARSVHVLSNFPLPERHLNGTVKSIGNDAWVITSNGQDVTVTINAQTKIVGSPKAGDPVEVIGWTDSANKFVALSIIKFERPQVVFFRGKVRTIAGDTWTLGPIDSEGAADDRVWIVQVTSDTKLVGNPRVGDDVEVTARGTTTLTALMIIKRPTVSLPTFQTFRGIVRSINGDTWEVTVDGDAILRVKVARTTLVPPGTRVGDRVEVNAVDYGDGYIALTIIRLRS
jgi:hypothetical protein